MALVRTVTDRQPRLHEIAILLLEMVILAEREGAGRPTDRRDGWIA